MLRSPLLALFLAVQGPSTAPERFFVGRTEGQGIVHVRLLRGEVGSHWVRDRGRGHFDNSGALVFEQVVQEKGEPIRRRSWRLIRSGNRITGTLSDAIGPVTGEIEGNVLRFRYQSRRGKAKVVQTIRFDPNGRTATSEVVAVGRLGLRVTVESTIRKLD